MLHRSCAYAHHERLRVSSQLPEFLMYSRAACAASVWHCLLSGKLFRILFCTDASLQPSARESHRMQSECSLLMNAKYATSMHHSSRCLPRTENWIRLHRRSGFIWHRCNSHILIIRFISCMKQIRNHNNFASVCSRTASKSSHICVCVCVWALDLGATVRANELIFYVFSHLNYFVNRCVQSAQQRQLQTSKPTHGLLCTSSHSVVARSRQQAKTKICKNKMANLCHKLISLFPRRNKRNKKNSEARIKYA